MMRDMLNVVLKVAGQGRCIRKRVHVNRLKPYYRQGFDQGELVTGRSGVQNQTLEDHLSPQPPTRKTINIRTRRTGLDTDATGSEKHASKTA